MASLSAIVSLLNEDRLIEGLNVSSEAAIEALLDARDSDEFAARWMIAFASVESMQRIAGHVQSELCVQIREAAYLRTISRWESPELAACVSDDFGLIADAVALGIEDPWIDGILKKYKAGEIPCTP